MIQINLIPDIKAEYLKAQRLRHSVLVIAGGIIVGSVLLLVMLSSYAFGVQNFRLNSLQSSINENTQQIKSNQDLDKILTIQNQMIQLTPLHDSKPVAARMFDFIQKTTPNNVQFDNYRVGFDGSTVEINGSAESVVKINEFVDTLKFTEVQTFDSAADSTFAFSNVVLESFGSGENSNFRITFNFNPILYNSSQENVVLVVPKITTTRSQTEQPSTLFNNTESEDF